MPNTGFTIGSKSLSDFGQCVASRDTGTPEKKSSTKTVPYMSGFYDFSEIYGAIAFESREVSYSIELIGDDREDLQEQKSELLNWLAVVHDEDIHDEDTPGWHFHGSFDSADWDEDESGESGTLDVTFLCHPFLIADEESSQTVAVGSGTVSNGGMSVNPYASVESGTGSIKLNGITQGVGTTPIRLTAQLLPGDNAVEVTGADVTLTWNEQRL